MSKKDLGLRELIAIALGGMVGGGIFSILGIATEKIGNAAPIAILTGGILAFFAAYSYVKLAGLYKDEGATYSFFKKTFPQNKKASSVIGWLIVFGYISTLALYAFTFASYFCSLFPILNHAWGQKIAAIIIIGVFAAINIFSVKGMGKIEDIMVYSKIMLLLIIAILLGSKGNIQHLQPLFEPHSTLMGILIVSALTFVAYEGFQLVIHAYNEMDSPEKNIPKAIYISIALATLLYVSLAFAALSTIPKPLIIADKEYALAAGAKTYLGSIGQITVIFGALLAASSAINGTLFGASRLMSVIAADGYFPTELSHKIKTYIPYKAILIMAAFAVVLLLTGGLQTIVEFGSITFIVVSFLMAYANHKKRRDTQSHSFITWSALIGLFIAGALIFYFEFEENPLQFAYILGIYFVLGLGAIWYAKDARARKQACALAPSPTNKPR